MVTLTPAARTGKGLNVGVTYPSAPGLYRLVMTLHDAAGVAYDAPTQSELRSVIVHVGGLYSAAFGAPSSLALGTGASSTVGVRVVNAGSQDWDVETPTPPAEPDSLLIWLRTQRTAARVVATWVSPQGLPVPASRLGGDRSQGGGARRLHGGRAVGRGPVPGGRLPAAARRGHADPRRPLDAGQHPGPDPGRRDGADDRAVAGAGPFGVNGAVTLQPRSPRAPALVGGD